MALLVFAFAVSVVLSRSSFVFFFHSESVDEIYIEHDVSISVQDLALNWSEFTDIYVCESLSELVIMDQVEWSRVQMVSQLLLFYSNRHAERKNCVLEIGCGHGMSLLRPLSGDSTQGWYTTTSKYIDFEK